MPDETSVPLDELARTIGALVSDAVLVVDPRGRIAHAAGSVETVLGVSPAELADRPIWAAIPGLRDESGFRKLLQRDEESGHRTVEGVPWRGGGPGGTLEVRTRSVPVQGGEWVLVLVRERGADDDPEHGGEGGARAGPKENVVDREIPVDDPAFEQAPLAHTQESADDGRILKVNQRAAELFGCSKEELTGQSVFELCADAPSGKGRARQLFERFRRGRAIVAEELLFRRAGGDHFWGHLFVRPVRDPGGRVLRSFSTIIDITERKEAEARLQESEERFRQLAEHIDGVFWITTPGKDVMEYVSPAYREIWGQSPSELYEDAGLWLERVHPDDRERVRRALPRQREGRYEEEYRIVRSDGEIRWIWDRAFPVENEEGDVYRIVGVAEDVTTRKALERRLEEARKMEALGTLAGGVAHNFNNLLTVILADVDLLSEGETDDLTEELLSEIRKAAREAQVLTERLLTFGQQSSATPEPLDLNRLLNDEEPMLRRTLGEGIDLDIDLSGDLPRVRFDRSRAEQVIRNLITNASEAMTGEGRVRVSTRAFDLHQEGAGKVADVEDASHVLLAVTDTGRGIEDGIRERIFDPFFTTKDRAVGEGLGLSIVRGVVERVGGTVEVDSTPGEGTTIRVYLPAVTEEPGHASGSVEVEGGAPGRSA